MDSMWARIDHCLNATAPLLAAAILFTCGYVVGRAAKEWYDSVPEYSECSESECSESECEDDNKEGDIVQSGGVVDDSAMEDDSDASVDDGDSSVDEGALAPTEPVLVEPEACALIQPIEFHDSDAEDPFVIEDVDDPMDPVDPIEFTPLVTEFDEPPMTDEPPVPETKG